MPYAIVKEGSKFVVRKKMLKGRLGRVFGRHDTREQAERQVDALHANVKEK